MKNIKIHKLTRQGQAHRSVFWAWSHHQDSICRYQISCESKHNNKWVHANLVMNSNNPDELYCLLHVWEICHHSKGWHLLSRQHRGRSKNALHQTISKKKWKMDEPQLKLWCNNKSKRRSEQPTDFVLPAPKIRPCDVSCWSQVSMSQKYSNVTASHRKSFLHDVVLLSFCEELLGFSLVVVFLLVLLCLLSPGYKKRHVAFVFTRSSIPK